MTPALEQQLRDRFPAMLTGLDGFWHRDGWFRVVIKMLELLEPHGVRVVGVKQKLGVLRVNLDRAHSPDSEVWQIVADAERRSRHVCETCGFGDFSGLSGDCQGCWR